MRPVQAGKSVRMSFSKQKEVLEMPNLIEIQKNSYQWFLDEGLKEVFEDISPIADFAGHLSLEFVDFTLCKDDIKYTIEECKERDATYAAPLKVKVRLCNKDKDEINEHEIFMGDLPLMTDTGSFVINGAERVIVSQLVRSPGIYYGIAHDKVGKELYTCTVIPNRGAWLEYETDSNDIFYVRVDRTRKVPVTVLIRALGYGTNAEIIDLFGEEPKLLASFGKDTSDNYQDGLLELYKKIRPGEPLSVDSAESLLNSMFFDPRRYDLAKVGRYKFNKKLHFKNRIAGHILAEDVVDTESGEILAEAGTSVDKDLATKIQNAGVPYVWVQGPTRNQKVLSNLMVDLGEYVDFDPKEAGISELVFYPALKAILSDRNLLLRVIREEILAIADKYGDDRRTSIGYDEYDISMEDLIPKENTVIAMTKLGYIKRMTVDNFRSQNRGGKGIKGMSTIEDDYIEELLMTTTHHYLMFFTSTGRVYRIKAYEIPEASRTARGTAIINLLQLQPEEKITAVIPINEFKKGSFLFMATKNGLVKKTPIEDYANVRKTGLAAIALREDDELIEVKFTDNKKDIILVTKFGQCIRFNETDVRVTGRVSMGVRGINLLEEDEVIGMQLTCQGDYLLIVSEKGLGKRTSVGEFTRQNRGGKGVKCYKITEKTGNVIGVKAVNSDNEIMLITTEGIIIRLECKDISILGRITSGVKLMDLKDDIKVASIAKVRDKDDEIKQEDSEREREGE